MLSRFSAIRPLARPAAGKIALAASLALFLAACQENGGLDGARAYRPISAETLALMDQKGTNKWAPVLLRAFKKEAELEVWKMKADGRYTLLKTFPMCRWSGQLGPKTREGDRQVPEGFYSITPAQMNPNSNYYLSFNVGYPNAYDRAYGRTGGSIMVHGACSSAGCFSMTDQQIAEIYAIARDAFGGGQKAIQMESLPFRMNAENLAKHRLDPNITFWKQLKEGADHFEVTKTEPKVAICSRRYVFNAQPSNPNQSLDANSLCPPLAKDADIETEVAAKQRRDDVAVAELVEKGVRPVRVLYADGGQHPDFTNRIAETSRPDALAQGPREIALDEGKIRKSPLVQIAALKSRPSLPAEPAAEGASVVAGQTALQGAETAATPLPPIVEQSKTSFYQRWIGGAEPAAPAIEAVEPAAPQPANVPLPPRRHAGLKAEKPQASLPRAIQGAAAPLPAGLTAYAATGE